MGVSGMDYISPLRRMVEGYETNKNKPRIEVTV